MRQFSLVKIFFKKCEWIFHEKGIFKWTISKKQKERYLIPRISRQMKIKITQVYHYTTIEGLKRKIQNTRVGENMKKWGLYYFVHGVIKNTAL